MLSDALLVRPLESGEAALWDDFVAGCEEATFFHRVGWKGVSEGAFGHRTHYLLAESASGVRGVLPLCHVKSRLFCNALVSTPLSVYGGVAAVDEVACLALETKAVELAVELGVDWLECRNRLPRQPEWSSKPLYYTFHKEMALDPVANLAAIPRKQRAEVRKGINNGLVAAVEGDIATRCFDIYSESLRNLGTPIFPRAVFELLQSTFGADCEGRVVEHQGRGVAAVVSFYFRDQVLPYYGGGTPEARALGAMAFMYWDLMRSATERGAKIFDFGRSKLGSGSFDFKKFYGFTPEPLHYRYHLVQAQSLPDINPLNPKYQLFIKVWKQLPLPLAEWMGPWVAKYLG